MKNNQGGREMKMNENRRETKLIKVEEKAKRM
jgi:hypothetical protein